MANLDMDKINEGIADRSDVFYWQTDRLIEPARAGQIWADRHRYFTDEELLRRVNEVLTADKLVTLDPLDLEAQTNLGNVSSVRTGKLQSGEEVVMRCFPKGVRNGYFHAEAAAAKLACSASLPSYKTLAIHEFTGGQDFAFHVLEKLQGTAIKVWLESHPEDETKLLIQIGRMMAQVHKLEVDGFGPFDNERAKQGALIGLHQTLGQALRAGLAFNLDVLVKETILTAEQSSAITKLFDDGNPLLATRHAVLVHNDFADWNLLTDGQDVTGILDWDESVGGDPVADIACWSTFFEPERMQGFLDGYWQVSVKDNDFQDKFELLRLRYILSKMTLRLRRFSWDPSEFMKEKIAAGKTHLSLSMEHFEI